VPSSSSSKAANLVIEQYQIRQSLQIITNIKFVKFGDFGRPFVKRFCPVLSVTLVHCGQTVRRVKIKPDVQVGLGPGHIVLDGDPGPPPQRGTAPNFRPISVVAKWLDGSRCHLVRR